MKSTLDELIAHYETLGGLWTKEAVRVIVEKAQAEERERNISLIQELRDEWVMISPTRVSILFDAIKAIREAK